MQRPTGVTILAVLALIGGILAILAGIALTAASSAIATASATSGYQITGTTATVLGIILLVGGVIDLAFGIGAFRGAGWAWVLGVLGQVLSLLSDVVSIVIDAQHNKLAAGITSNIVSIAISVFILYYLNRPNVKAFFGRA